MAVLSRSQRANKYISQVQVLVGISTILYVIIKLGKHEQDNISIMPIINYANSNSKLYNPRTPTNHQLPLFTISTITTDGEDVSDELFKVNENCLRLRRIVQMYQWKPCVVSTIFKLIIGGVLVTHNTRTWADHKISTQHHINPEFGISSKVFTANDIKLDNGLKLGKIFTEQINWKNNEKSGNQFQKWNYYDRNYFENDTLEVPEVGVNTEMKGNLFWNNHRVGDYRVYWECLGDRGNVVSVLGKVSEVPIKSSSKKNHSMFSLIHQKAIMFLTRASEILPNSIQLTSAKNQIGEIQEFSISQTTPSIA